MSNDTSRQSQSQSSRSAAQNPQMKSTRTMSSKPTRSKSRNSKSRKTRKSRKSRKSRLSKLFSRGERGFQPNPPGEVARGRGVNRRQFLASMGLAAASVPFLEFFSGQEALAQAVPGGPKRFVVMVHGQGTAHNHWHPGPDFTLPYLLEPLEPYKDNIVVVDGLTNATGLDLVINGPDGHQGPTCSALTANWMSQGPLADGPSIDQEIAGHIGTDTPFRTLNLGVGADPNWKDIVTNMLYSGPQQPVSSNGDPANVFSTVFGGIDDQPDEMSALQDQQLSVLDATKDQFATFRARLGHEDRLRLDAHTERIRALENEIQSLSDRLQSCTRPELSFPSGYDFWTPMFWPETSRAQIELMAMSMACDLTRVGSLMFTDMHAPEFPFLASGGSVVPQSYDNWHDMVHNGFNEAGEPEQAILDGFRWYGEQFALLLETFAAYEDADGDNLLETTCFLWISDHGYANWHHARDMPIVLAGNCGGPMGRHLDLRPDNWLARSYAEKNDWSNSVYGPTTHQLYVSLLNGFGVETDQFGDYRAGGNPGGLPGLLG